MAGKGISDADEELIFAITTDERLAAEGSNRFDQSGAGEVTTGTWYHVVAVKLTSSTWAIYKDGTSLGLTGGTAPAAATFPELTIGVSRGTALDFNGIIAYFSLHDGLILTATQIGALSRGAIPFIMLPNNITFFFPIFGNDSPEPGYRVGSAPLSGTLTGTTKTSGNPPVELLENYL